MVVYLISFAVSLLLIGFTEKKRKEYFIAASVVALLIPCLVAGLRSETVGTDISVYVRPMVDVAKRTDSFHQFWNSSWFYIWRDKFVNEHEIGFSLVLYYVTKLTGSIGCVLFVIQAVTIVPIFTALALNRKNAPVWPGMLVYYLMYYNSTLNMMRQWMAMGILLLAFRMLMDRKYWQCFLLTILAVLFHYSAIIVLPIYMIWWFLGLFRKKTIVQGDIQVSTKMLMILLIFAVGAVVLLNLNLVLRLLIAAGLNRFANYLSGNSLSLLVNQVILRIPLLCITLFSWNRLRKATPAAPFFLTMLLLDLLASQIASVSTYAFRIAFYFAQYSILLVPYLFRYQKTPFERKSVALILSAFYGIYWIYYYVLEGYHQTLPYVFSFIS